MGRRQNKPAESWFVTIVTELALVYRDLIVIMKGVGMFMASMVSHR